MNQEKFREKETALLRHLIGSIDLSDVGELDKDTLGEEEYMNRASESEAFYRHFFDKVLKSLIQKQLEWIGNQAQNDLELSFGRGTINGLNLIKDWFEEQVGALGQKIEDSRDIPNFKI